MFVLHNYFVWSAKSVELKAKSKLIPAPSFKDPKMRLNGNFILFVFIVLKMLLVRTL